MFLYGVLPYTVKSHFSYARNPSSWACCLPNSWEANYQRLEKLLPTIARHWVFIRRGRAGYASAANRAAHIHLAKASRGVRATNAKQTHP